MTKNKEIVNEVFHVHGYKPDYRKRQLKTEEDKKRGCVFSPHIHVCAAQNRSELMKECFGFQRGGISGKMLLLSIMDIEKGESIWTKDKGWVA